MTALATGAAARGAATAQGPEHATLAPRLRMGLVACLLLASAATAAPDAAPGAQPSQRPSQADTPRQPDAGPDLDAATSAIVAGTNDFRRKHDLPKLESDPRLAQTAQDFARYMAKTGRYGHQLKGTGPAQRARAQGYDYCLIAENIGRQFDSRGFTTDGLAAGFVEGWKQSPGHRKNMLDADLTEIGVGIARSANTGYYYAVQLFGRPRSASISFQVDNATQTSVEYQLGEENFRLAPRYRRTHRLCRPAQLRFVWGSGREATTVHPSSGADYRVVRDDAGQLQLNRR